MHYNLGLIGYGGVNRALVDIIHQQGESLEQHYGLTLSVTFVSDLFLGSAQDPQGLDLNTLITLPREAGALAQLPGGSEQPHTENLIKQGMADIIAEATFTNADTGQPATGYCEQALSRGMHVVTTNKGPVALAADHLKDIAREQSCEFLFEGAVMSGTPVLNLAEETLAGNAIESFSGILNGTCNYIIEQMENGVPQEQAIAQAQALGYAEANPKADVEGLDVKLKVAILAQQLLRLNVSIDTIACQGIADLTLDDVQSALRENCRWKLIGEGTPNSSGGYDLSVGLKKLPTTHPLAGIGGPVNALCFNTALLGPVTIAGPGAGRTETGFALLSDILRLHRKQQRLPL